MRRCEPCCARGERGGALWHLAVGIHPRYVSKGAIVEAHGSKEFGGFPWVRTADGGWLPTAMKVRADVDVVQI